MAHKRKILLRSPKLLDVVELLAEHASFGIAPGSLGTVVDELPNGAFLVEFTDKQGRELGVLTVTKKDVSLVD